MLHEYSVYPDYPRYLCYILANAELRSGDRSLAGVILKNYLAAYYQSIPGDIWNGCRITSLAALGDPVAIVRSAASLVVAVIAKRGGLQHWPELMPTLCGLLDSGNQPWQEGAMTTFKKIVEDCLKELNEPQYNDYVNIILQKLIPFFSVPVMRLSTTAMHTVCQFIIAASRQFHPSLQLNMQPFITQLFQASASPHQEVRRQVLPSGPIGIIKSMKREREDERTKERKKE
jgi:transportin-1